MNSIVCLDKTSEIIDFQHFFAPALKVENVENQAPFRAGISDFQYFISPALKGENVENQASVMAKENVNKSQCIGKGF